MSDKTTTNVLVVGAGGNTGFPITTALLETKQFNVHVLCRSESQLKPRITSLKALGAQVRIGDVIKSTLQELESILKEAEIEIIVSAVGGYKHMESQKNLFQAAKNVGTVRRVVPSDFGLVSAPGEILIGDLREDVHAYIKSLGLSYTFINVGWWMDFTLPFPSSATGIVAARSRIGAGTGDVKVALTSRIDIGRFVARIIADPRTLNKSVFCYADEVTLNEVYDVANKVSGEDLKSTVKLLSKEELESQIQTSQEAYAKEPAYLTYVNLILAQCFYFIFIRGQNTVAKAKEYGAIDARALYPDFQPLTIEEYAKLFYKELPDIFWE